MTHAKVTAGPTEQQKATEQTTAETPVEAANRALKAIDPTTAVTVSRTARVAGRAAYQLSLAPRDSRWWI